MRPKLHLSGRFGLFSRCYPRSPLNTDGDSSVACSLLTRFPPFLFPSTTSPRAPLFSQEPVCQQKPCTSPCAYQTVYPFPVGAVFHLWLWQPIATPRVHSKPWFRHPALPALLYQPFCPLSHVNFSHARYSVITSCQFLMHARLKRTQI